MKTISTIAVAAVLALGLASAAQAQSASAQIPTPANPYPANPIATDGSALPVHGEAYGLRSGRSVFAPVGDVVSSVGSVVTGR